MSRVHPSGLPHGVDAVRAGLQDLIVTPFVRAQINVEAYGAAPTAGPVLLVANHASHLDTAVVMASLPAPVRRRIIVGVQETKWASWWRWLAASSTFHLVRLDRFTPATAQRRFAGGWSVLGFGEPSRSDDGSVHTFDQRIAELALLAARRGVAVIPVGIRGTFAALPRGQGRIRRGRPRVSVRYGQPLALGPTMTAETAAQALTVAVRRLIDEDSRTWWQVIRDVPEPLRPPPEAARWRRIWARTGDSAKGVRAATAPIWQRDTHG